MILSGPVARLAIINLLRNRRRTLLTALPTAAGLSALLLLWAFNDALQSNMTENFQDTLVGSIQIHQKGFFTHPALHSNMGDARNVLQAIRELGIRRWTMRLESFVLAAGKKGSNGMMMIAIDPEHEKHVTHLHTLISSGHYLQYTFDNPCLLGSGAAQNLGVNIGDSIDLIAIDRFGAPVGEKFIVTGIIQGGGFGLDRDIVFVPLRSAQNLLEMGNRVTNIVIRTDQARLGSITDRLRKKLSADQYEILRWYDMFPVMQEWITLQNGFEVFFIAIVMLLIGAAVSNVALVANLSRRREFGVMLAIGNNGTDLWRLLMAETLLLGLVGTISGIVIATITIRILSITGIDLSELMGDTRRYYIDPVLRPVISTDQVIWTSFTVFLFNLLAGIYPAWRTGRLQPVEAMQYHG